MRFVEMQLSTLNNIIIRKCSIYRASNKHHCHHSKRASKALKSGPTTDVISSKSSKSQKFQVYLDRFRHIERNAPQLSK